jgi:hypothetical protein
MLTQLQSEIEREFREIEPAERTLAYPFLAQVVAEPLAIALSVKGETFTYQALFIQAYKIAEILQTFEQQRILVLVQRQFQGFAALLGCL